MATKKKVAKKKAAPKKKGHRTLYTQIKINSITNKKSEN